MMYAVETMDEVLSRSLRARRFSMVLLGVFAALALVMSCVGIYGVISFLAAARTHEIGIRMALGAERGDVLKMVLGEAAGMALLGVGVGLTVALALTRLMASLLFGVSAHDPLTLRRRGQPVGRGSPRGLLHPRPPRHQGGSHGGAEARVIADCRLRKNRMLDVIPQPSREAGWSAVTRSKRSKSAILKESMLSTA